MQTVTNLFDTICASPNWTTLVKADIAGTEYTMSDLISMSRSVQCMDSVANLVGNAMAGQADLRFIPKSVIPKAAQVKLYIAVTNGSDTSEWIPHGTYYVSERFSTEFANGTALELTCYDAMCKTDMVYKNSTWLSTWPQTDTAVATDIARAIGVTLDARTSLGNYNVPYPNNYTMREILQFIAVANCGNWIITPEDKLLLVPVDSGANLTLLGDNDDAAIRFGTVYILVNGSPGDEYDIPEYNITRSCDAYEDMGVTPPYSGIHLFYGDEDAFVAGDSAGYVLEQDCPWATQTIVDDMYSILNEYEHQGFEAVGAFIPPNYELGDIAIVDGVQYTINELRVDYGTLYKPTLASPGRDDIENEYPYLSPTEREVRRAVKIGKQYYGTSITQSAGITVERTDGNDTYNAVKLNSDVFEAIDENGNPVMRMDFVNQAFQWTGDIVIQDGSVTLAKLNNDVTDYVTGEVTNLGDDVTRQIAATQTGILTTVSDNYATQQSVTDSGNAIRSEVNQTISDITATFTQTTNDIASNVSSNTDAVNTISSHIQIGFNEMTFTVDNSEYKMKLTNTGMQVLGEGDNVICEFTAGGVLLPSQTTVPLGGTFRLGNFQWTPRSSGNLSMVYVGD